MITPDQSTLSTALDVDLVSFTHARRGESEWGTAGDKGPAQPNQRAGALKNKGGRIAVAGLPSEGCAQGITNGSIGYQEDLTL